MPDNDVADMKGTDRQNVPEPAEKALAEPKGEAEVQVGEEPATGKASGEEE